MSKTKEKSLWNVDFIGFLYVVLFYLSKNHVLTQFWWVFFQLKTVWSVTFVFWSKVQTLTRFFVFKCNIYAHGISLLLFSWSSLGNFTSFVVSFQRYTVWTWVISSSFIKFHSWSCYFIVSTTFVFLRFWSATCRYCHFFLPPLNVRAKPFFNLKIVRMTFVNFNSITKIFCKVKLLDRFFEKICQIFILLTSQSEFSKMFKKMPKILDSIYIYI